MGALIPEDNNLGALFLGVVLSSIIYGVTWQQVYSYYTVHGANDRLLLKTFVAVLMVMDSVNLAFAIHGSYVTSITNFGDYAADARMPWSIPSIGITGMILEVFIQHFYAYRVYRLSRGTLYMPIIITLLSLTAFALGLVFCIRLVIIPFETEAHSHIRFFIATIAMQAACDIIITTSMVCYLMQNRTSVPRTNSVLNMLALYIISCGTLTALSGVTCLITISIFEHNWIYVPFYILQVRLYSCSFMSVLNSRDHIRQKFMGSDGGVITMSQLQRHSNSHSTNQSRPEDGPHSPIHVATPVRPHRASTVSSNTLAFDLEKYLARPTP
ncbi:hypothetical protein BC834DRAFT_891571 [Gloeopeniophorella convolvens]|nr:hypothetical protein BC834DRAFT_891571 [Gloeopeniophorella convolvens]